MQLDVRQSYYAAITYKLRLLITLKMATWVVERCLWSLCNKITLKCTGWGF